MAYLGLSQHIDFSKLPAPENRFTLSHLIGEGTYGEVFSAKDTRTGASVAIKVSTKILLRHFVSLLRMNLLKYIIVVRTT